MLNKYVHNDTQGHCNGEKTNPCRFLHGQMINDENKLYPDMEQHYEMKKEVCKLQNSGRVIIPFMGFKKIKQRKTKKTKDSP